MASGLKVKGVDLDDIFKSRTSPKRSNVEFEVNGVDISNRYEPSTSNPRSQISYNTGYTAGGTDLRYLFMTKAFNPFAINLNFTIVQYNADCWEIYVGGNKSVSCKLDITWLVDIALWFNPTDPTQAGNYIRFNERNQGNGQKALTFNSITFYNSNGTVFEKYGIGKSFSVPSNNWRGDGNTTAKFTIANSTVANKGDYKLISNLYSGSNNATAKFNMTFDSYDELK